MNQLFTEYGKIGLIVNTYCHNAISEYDLSDDLEPETIEYNLFNKVVLLKALPFRLTSAPSLWSAMKFPAHKKCVVIIHLATNIEIYMLNLDSLSPIPPYDPKNIYAGIKGDQAYIIKG